MKTQLALVADAQGLEALARFLAVFEKLSSLRRANIYEPHYYRHMVSGTRLIRQEPEGWRVHTNFQVIRTMHSGEMSLFAAGLFDDVVVEREGTLLFKEKIVICDSPRIDTLLVIPL